MSLGGGLVGVRVLTRCNWMTATADRDVDVITALLVDTFEASPVDLELVTIALVTCITLATRFVTYYRIKGYIKLVGAIFQLYLDAPLYAPPPLSRRAPMAGPNARRRPLLTCLPQPQGQPTAVRHPVHVCPLPRAARRQLPAAAYAGGRTHG